MMKITFSLAILICALIFTSQVFALPAFSLRNAIGLFQRETACIALSNCPGQKSNPPASAPKPSPSPPPPPPPEPSPEPSPTPSAEPPVEIQRAAMKIYTYSCTKEQKAAVQKAWDEAAVLADAHSKWESPGWFGWGEKYQAAMDMYLGADSRKDKPTFFGTGPLKSNVMRQRGIHYSDSSWSPRWSYGYFYCNEDAVPKLKDKPKPRVCSKARTTGRRVAVFTFADDGYIWNAKYVVLCPRFFEGDVTTLEAKVARAQRRPDLQRTMGDFWRRIKAGVIFHETYHWGKDEVSDPRCYLKEEIYNPERVVELALDKNVEIARLNAESWTQAVMAIYIQKTFNQASPPGPKKKVASSDKNKVKVIPKDNSANLEVHALESMPDWFAPPVLPNAAKKNSGQQPEPNPPVPTDDPLLEMLDPSPDPPKWFD